MEGKMMALKEASHSWWFDSHSSARRSPWLQSTLSEMEKKTKSMLNLIEGDADSFAQRAEIYYKKRPELVSMIEDFYRSYRYLAEQHELLKSEVGSRRSISFKCDSSIQSSPQKTWDSADASDYPESEASEVDNLEPEEAVEIESMFVAAYEEDEGMRTLEAESSVVEIQDDLQGENKLIIEILPLRKQNGQKTSKSKNDASNVCTMSTQPLPRSQLEYLFSECDVFSHHVCEESITKPEMEDCNGDDYGTKCDLLKLENEVNCLKMVNGNLSAEIEQKDEEKRQVIRQLSFTVDILKEENVRLKKFIKSTKRSDIGLKFEKLKDAFSQTGRLFGLSSPLHPSLIAL